jgi:hypothetical protein
VAEGARCSLPPPPHRLCRKNAWWIAHLLSALGRYDHVELVDAVNWCRESAGFRFVTRSDIRYHSIEYDVRVFGDRTEILRQTDEESDLFMLTGRQSCTRMQCMHNELIRSNGDCTIHLIKKKTDNIQRNSWAIFMSIVSEVFSKRLAKFNAAEDIFVCSF